MFIASNLYLKRVHQKPTGLKWWDTSRVYDNLSAWCLQCSSPAASCRLLADLVSYSFLMRIWHHLSSLHVRRMLQGYINGILQSRKIQWVLRFHSFVCGTCVRHLCSCLHQFDLRRHAYRHFARGRLGAFHSASRLRFCSTTIWSSDCIKHSFTTLGGFGADMAGQGCSVQAKLHPNIRDCKGHVKEVDLDFWSFWRSDSSPSPWDFRICQRLLQITCNSSVKGLSTCLHDSAHGGRSISTPEMSCPPWTISYPE